MALFLVIAVVLFVCWICFKLSRWNLEKMAESIPGEKPLPLVGNAIRVFTAKCPKDVMNLVKDYIAKFEKYGIMKGWLGPLLLVVVCDPKYIETLAESPHASSKGNFYIHFLGRIFKGVFVVSGGAEWKELRKPLMKLQGKKNILNEYHNIFVTRNKNFIKYLKEKKCGKEIDIIDEFRHLAFEIISETHFGVDVDEVRNPKFYWLENLDRFIAYTATAGAMNLFQFIKVLKNFTGLPKPVKRSVNDMLGYSEWVFEERKKRFAQGDTKDAKEYYPDFLIRRGIEKQKPLIESYKELSDLISGGGDTTSVTLASALVFFAMFPEYQEEAYQEQFSIFSDDNTRDPRVDDLSLMEFLGRFMKETLRHVGPYIFFKAATDNFNIDKYTIPKGATIVIFTEPLHFNKKYWEKPNDFYPDHFLPEKEATRPCYSYVPFGCGMRICPGVQYSTNSLKIALSYILRNFKIYTSLKFDECDYDYRFMRVLTSGYMVRLEERSMK